MANDEHLEIFNRGRQEWNKWRLTPDRATPDFRGADLSGRSLRSIDLSSADIAWANLTGADLSYATLGHANLNGARLANANLSSASLNDATLTGAHLENANLSRAKLVRANLNGARLAGANLTEAELNETTLIGADLTNAILGRCNARDASFVWAELKGTLLKDARLSGADLRDADLRRVDLTNAQLQRAILDRAKLQNVKLVQAELSFATLRSADLTNADLAMATLVSAELNKTKLSGANMGYSRIGGAIFVDVDLREVKGLESIQHYGPSTLSQGTLALSHGELPEGFLQGCGLKDWEIEVAKLYRADLTPGQFTDITYKIHDLRSNPLIQFHSCFISYSGKDEGFAQKLFTDLQSRGVRCWFAPEHMKIGDHIRNRIDDSIRLHDKLLLVLSEASVGSQWVEQEVETALEKERERGESVLFPVRLDAAVMSIESGWPKLIRNTRHIGDFSNWGNAFDYESAFSRLRNDLRASR